MFLKNSMIMSNSKNAAMWLEPLVALISGGGGQPKSPFLQGFWRIKKHKQK